MKDSRFHELDLEMRGILSLAGLAVAAGALDPAAQSARDDFDCPMRVFMLSYAAQIQPFRSPEVFQQLADALNGDPEKAPGCDVSAEVRRRRLALGTPGASNFVAAPGTAAAPSTESFFVDAQAGSDSNNGTLSYPFKTIPAALAAARAAPGNDTIFLRAGTYYQSATIVLGTADSGLTIQAFPGEEAWVSGAAPLVNLTWTAYNVNASSSWAIYNNTNAVFADVPGPGVVLNGTYPTAAGCSAACEANQAAGGLCTIWTWHDQNQGGYALQCYFREDGDWAPQTEPGHVSGHFTSGPNVWVASLAGTGITSVPGLRLNGGRMIRARYPNGNPELSFGGNFNALSWTPQSAPRVPDIQIDLAQPVRNTSVSAFQTFTAGIGGTCDRFDPPAGYWCSTHVQGGGSTVFYSPTAVQVNASQLPHMPYKNPVGGIINTWRNGHWASWMYEIGSWTYDDATTFANFTFGYGGFQGSRGDDSAAGTYFENIFEELDAPGEFFFDPATSLLYFWNNATAGTPPPNDGSLQVTQVKNLFNVTGTRDAPVTDVSFVSLGFRDTAYTYMDPHTFPSGGDWTIARSGVVALTNTERVAISGCVFSRVDGNAVLIASYNRNTTVEYNAFEWLGESAVVSVGDTEGGDDRLPFGYGLYGTNGSQPRGSRIRFNTCRELGIWEKQSSFYTTFKSGRNTVEGNLVWNGPRAHINVNDGFMGGNLFDRNILVNSCRESGDHGPVNSWDRDVYLWDALDGSTTFVKDPDVFTRNALLGDYSTLCTVDNDDGSSYFTVHNNFAVYGGCAAKNDFEGHDGHHYSNVYAFMGMGLDNGYGGNIGPNLDGHEDQFFSNFIAVNQDGDYAKPVCSGRGTSVIANNTVWTPTGNVTECGSSLAAWQAQGGDPGTTAAAYPSTATILDYAQLVLGVSVPM